MAKTYRISGYFVDVNGDDLNTFDIDDVIGGYLEVNNIIDNLRLEASPTWEWKDDCPENHGKLTDEMCERRFIVRDENLRKD